MTRPSFGFDRSAAPEIDHSIPSEMKDLLQRGERGTTTRPRRARAPAPSDAGRSPVPETPLRRTQESHLLVRFAAAFRRTKIPLARPTPRTPPATHLPTYFQRRSFRGTAPSPFGEVSVPHTRAATGLCNLQFLA